MTLNISFLIRECASDIVQVTMSADTSKDKRKDNNIKPFDGQRYSIWRKRVRALIAEDDALQVLDEEAPAEPSAPWRKKERIAKGVLCRNLADNLIGFASEDESAREMLQRLDAIYQRQSVASQVAIEKKLALFKIKEDVPLGNQLLQFDELMLEYFAATGTALSEAAKISRLLISLPKSYDSVAAAIESHPMDILLVKDRLLDHEIKLQHAGETSTKVLSAEVKQDEKTQSERNKDKEKKSKNKSKNKKKFNKNFKGKRGRNKSKWNNYNNYNNNKKCDHCGRNNHEKPDCYFYKRQKAAEERPRTLQTVQLEDRFALMNIVGHAFREESASDQLIFLLDSGATDHLINRANVFTTVEDLVTPLKISIAKRGESIVATKRGTIEAVTDLGFPVTLTDVLYAEDIPFNVMSVRRMQAAGLSVLFAESGKVTIRKGNNTIATGKSLNLSLSCIVFNLNKKVCSQANVNENTSLNTYKIWHERLGHINKSKFLEIKRNELLLDTNRIESINPTNEVCEPCIYGKQAQLPFSKARDRSHISRPLFAIYSDVCGKITPCTYDGKNYFLSFIDEFTHYTVIYLLINRSEVFRCFQDYVAKCEAHFNMKIAHLYCDNGPEYLSNEFKSFCAQKGIQYHLTVPYTPQQNSISERMNRTIVEKARAMLHGAELGKEFWGDAVSTATYLINITPTTALSENKTPFEMWHKRKPRLLHLKIFGCTVYVHDKTRKSKFDSKSIKGILVGYSHNGYKVLIPETNRIIFVRDVIFDELNFKRSRPSVQQTKEDEGSKAKRQKTGNEQIEISQENEINKSVTETGKINEMPVNGTNSQTDNNLEISEESNIDDLFFPKDNQTTLPNQSNEYSQPETPVRRSERIKNMPTRISYNEELYYCSLSVNDVPTSYEEIKHRADRVQWEQAMKEELKSLLQNNTWEYVSCPFNKNIVDSKWVFSIKIDAFGNPKYKARLVARGFSQQYLIDYKEVFAPVVRINTFRLMIAFANQHNLLIHQMDVKTAFLHGKLEEEIYMRIPEGIVQSKNKVCKLNKAIYGLKQSARCWFTRFDEVLKRHGFINSSSDRCLYILDRGDIRKNIYVILYVDDTLLMTFDLLTMIKFKKYLKEQFSMVDMNEAKLFLGINIERKNNVIHLSQTSYLESVLKKFNMQDCNAVSTPLPTKLNYKALNADVFYDAPIKNLIGCLSYAMLCTRPDLCFSLNVLSRYQSKNNQEVWLMLKRILRYVKGTLNLKLKYESVDFNDILTGFVDSDWATDEIDRKSTSGYLFKMFGKNTISWNSRKQDSVATSSTEAEYMALFEGIREACWLKSLLKSINIDIAKPIVIFEDNTSCITIANNPVDHKKSKHFEVKYHFSREKIEQKVITLKYVPTAKQIADAFTKSLPTPHFVELRAEMGLVEHTNRESE